MKFEFIDNNSSVDRAVRRQIRSHVAKGRNVGRRLNRPSKRHPRRAAGQSVHREQTPEPAALVEAAASAPAQVTPGFPSPAPAHWRNHGGNPNFPLIHRVALFFGAIRHAPELDGALDYGSEPRTTWVEPIFVNDAYFHAAMAVFMTAFPGPAALCFAPGQRPGPDISAARVDHVCVALRLVNSRLSSKDAVSDETMIAILVLGLYERYQGEYRRGLVHLGGLQQMLSLRGGLDAFARTKLHLARKIFRADVEYSLHLGIPTRLSILDVEPHLTNMTIPPKQHPPNSHPTSDSLHPPPPLNENLPLNPQITALLQTATRTAHLLNTAASSPAGPRVSSAAAHDTFILLAYRVQALLSPRTQPAATPTATTTTATTTTVTTTPAAPPTNPEASPTMHVCMNTCERALTAGLAAFVTSFLWGGGCGGVRRAPLRWLEALVREVARGFSFYFTCDYYNDDDDETVGGVCHYGDTGDHGDGWRGDAGVEFAGVAPGLDLEREAVLWMVFVCAAAGVFGDGEVEGWVVSFARTVMVSLGLREWGDVVGVLERFPWVGVLDWERARAFFERCTTGEQ